MNNFVIAHDLSSSDDADLDNVDEMYPGARDSESPARQKFDYQGSSNAMGQNNKYYNNPNQRSDAPPYNIGNPMSLYGQGLYNQDNQIDMSPGLDSDQMAEEGVAGEEQEDTGFQQYIDVNQYQVYGGVVQEVPEQREESEGDEDGFNDTGQGQRKVTSDSMQRAVEGILASQNDEDDEPLIRDYYMDDEPDVNENLG